MAILTPDDLKGVVDVRTGEDRELLVSFIAAAEAAVSRPCGHLTPVTVTERVNGDRALLSLQHTPVASLISVTPVDGAALDVASLYVDPSSGVVENDGAGGFSDRRYTVVYRSGWDPVPDDLRRGVIELVRHMWTQQVRRAAGGRPSAPAEPGEAYLWPYRVQQYIAPYTQVAI